MLKPMDFLCTALLLLYFSSVVQSVQSKSVETAVSAPKQANTVDNVAGIRKRRSYFWVEDDSDKVTIIESEGLRRDLENYRRKQHGEQKRGERKEYGVHEKVQEHKPLFVPNLFG